MRNWPSECKDIAPLDPVWRQRASRRLREQTRPEGSLGLLERLLERLVAIQKKAKPSVQHKRILVFAADHGIAAEGVSLYPAEVTRAMVLNFLNGGATVNSLARFVKAEVKVIDIGVNADFAPDPRLIHAKIGRGTRNFLREPAMTAQELDRALAVGWDLVHQAKTDGIELLGLGEMGIGNTTAASAVMAVLLDRSPEAVTGRGTGLGDAALAHKIKVIWEALEKHKPFLRDPLSVLQYVGGFELAAMTGAILAAAKLSLPAVVDGWIVSASALAALRLNERVLDYLFFAHESEESGHRLFFETLETEPVLNFSMRLGEASGAALAMGILDAAVHIYNEVATFTEAGVADREY